MQRDSKKRTAKWGAISVFAAAAAATTLAITTGTGLASVHDTPGLAPVPPGQQGYLDAPAANADGKPETKEKKAPASLSCHRWKDGTITQTFDPASPACVSRWDFAKGNGGSTATGVDENVIKIAVAKSSPELEGLVNWFNANYQFYGRSISLVETGGYGSPAQQRAAVSAAAEQGAFAMAAIDTANITPADSDTFLAELAKRKIIGVAPGGVKNNASLAKAAPYAWTTEKTVEGTLQDIGKLTCSSLKDGAPLTGISSEKGQGKRSFAILTPSGAESPKVKVDTSSLVAVLKKCGIDAPVHEYQSSGFTNDPALGSRDQGMYQRLKADGVTTLLFTGDADELSGAQVRHASAAGFQPEWVVSRGHPRLSPWQDIPKDQNKKIIGIFQGLDSGDPEQNPAYRAFIESGADPTGEWTYLSHEAWYSALAAIAAGIQGAGPNLTPESFAAGLEAQEFPAPRVVGQPEDRPRYGFQLGNHTFQQDSILARLDPDKTVGYFSYDWCPVDEGKRFGFAHDWPKDDTGIRNATSECS